MSEHKSYSISQDVNRFKRFEERERVCQRHFRWRCGPQQLNELDVSVKQNKQTNSEKRN